MSPRPCSQVINASGLDDLTSSAALKLVGRSTFSPASLSETRVVPGARKSSLLHAPGFPVAVQFGGDVLQRTSAQHDLLGGEVDLRGDRDIGIPDISARTAGSTRDRLGLLLSLLSLWGNLSASSWRADSAARSSGDAPKRRSPLPDNFSARSSAP